MGAGITADYTSLCSMYSLAVLRGCIQRFYKPYVETIYYFYFVFNLGYIFHIALTYDRENDISSTKSVKLSNSHGFGL